MSDKTLKYQVWRGEGKQGKLATFRDLEAAMRFLLSTKQTFDNAYIYDVVTEKHMYEN